mmetsp:Transcript_28641/g.62492  ORF Transcript_28641/g.62492 Transcript_28641/m.62492 type:complete len:225 (-) Transcript_28641:1429-2103(-)
MSRRRAMEKPQEELSLRRAIEGDGALPAIGVEVLALYSGLGLPSPLALAHDELKSFARSPFVKDMSLSPNWIRGLRESPRSTDGGAISRIPHLADAGSGVAEADVPQASGLKDGQLHPLRLSSSLWQAGSLRKDADIQRRMLESCNDEAALETIRVKAFARKRNCLTLSPCPVPQAQVAHNEVQRITWAPRLQDVRLVPDLFRRSFQGSCPAASISLGRCLSMS